MIMKQYQQPLLNCPSITRGIIVNFQTVSHHHIITSSHHPMWTCPTCQRSFKRKDQQHSCEVSSVENAFSKRPQEFKKIYDKIISALRSFGDFREEAIGKD